MDKQLPLSHDIKVRKAEACNKDQQNLENKLKKSDLKVRLFTATFGTVLLYGWILDNEQNYRKADR